MGTLNSSDITQLTNISDAVGQGISDAVTFVNSQIQTLVAELTNIVPFFSPSVAFDNKNIMKQIALDPVPSITPSGDTGLNTVQVLAPSGLTETALGEPDDPVSFTPLPQTVLFPEAGSFESNVDTVIIPDIPILNSTGLVPEVPDITLPSIPTAPILALPTKPVFDQIVIPDIPILNLPSFGETLPAFDLTLPDFNFEYIEGEYSSSLLDATTLKLLNDIQNGGTGLGAVVEQEIYDRGAERDARNLITEANRLRSEFSIAGFDLPFSTLIENINDLISKHDDKKADLSREIVIEQANLAQNNTQFSIENSIKLEGITIAHFNQVAERAFQSAKTTSDFQIAVLEAQIGFFNLRLQRYSEAANVHFQLLKNELVKVDLFKAELSAVDSKIASKGLEIEVYKQSIDALIAEINLFNAEVEKYKIQVDGQRALVEVATERIRAYNAVLEHDKNKIDLYNASLRTIGVEFEKIQAQIGIHNAQLQSVKTNSDNRAIELNALIDDQKNQLAASAQLIEKYRALSSRVSQREGTLNTKYANDINNYEAFTDTQWDAIKGAQENVRIKLDHAVKDMDRIVTLTKLAIEKNHKEFDFRTATMQSVLASKQFIMEAGARSEDITTASA